MLLSRLLDVGLGRDEDGGRSTASGRFVHVSWVVTFCWLPVDVGRLGYLCYWLWGRPTIHLDEGCFCLGQTLESRLSSRFSLSRFTMKAFLRALLVCVFFLSQAGPVAAQDSTALSKELRSARVALVGLMTKWEEHRGQKILVLDIKGLSDAKAESGELSRLENRLKTLLNKTRSNREWKAYWQEEARLAGEVLGLYNKLTPTTGSGALSSESNRLQKEAIAADRLAQAKSQALQSAQGAQKEARLAVQEALKRLDTQKSELSAKNVTAQTSIDALSGRVDKVKEQVASARTDVQKAELTARLGEMAERLKRLSKEHTDQAGALEEVIASRRALNTVIQGKEPVWDGVGSLTKGVAQAFATSTTAVAQALAAQRTAQGTYKGLLEASQSLVLEDERFGLRRDALASWRGLAGKKVANQDTYYKAIQSDIEAVRDRLRSFKKVQASAEFERSDDVCERTLAAEQTSLMHYRACVTATKAEIAGLKATLEQRAATTKLTQRLLESTQNLLVAQRLDEDLVQEELTISSGELKRSKGASESKDWQLIWTHYAAKAGSKVSKLSAAVVTSKETQRALNVNTGLVASEVALMNEKLASLEEVLLERDNTAAFVGSIFSTGLELIQIGWPALIYLLLAWLIMRATHRVSNRVVAQAEESDDDEDTDELRAEFEAAEAAQNTSRVTELRDQLTIFESRRRDAAQRVTTLTNIARGAIKTVVYIATSLMVLDALTVDIGPILGGAAIFGLAISFGSQSLVKDVVTGFFILLENQYAVGDVVTINGNSGGVERITLRRTVLRDVKGGVHNIPNGTITAVINSTQGWARAVVHLGVAYGTDMEKVAGVVNATGDAMYAEDVWNAKLMEPPRYIGVTAFNASDVTFRTMFKTHTFENWGAEREWNGRIKVAFEQANIEIPFPQTQVHLVKDAG